MAVRSKSKASGLTKRVLGMEFLESREMLSGTAPYYDVVDYVQTAASGQMTILEEPGGTEQPGTPLAQPIAPGLASKITLTTAKLEWALPAGTKLNGNYSVYVSREKLDTVESLANATVYETKTASLQLSDLWEGTTHYYYIRANLSTGDNTPLAAGSFQTVDFPEQNSIMDGTVPVGQVTDVKAVYVAASLGRSAGIKVTWKAPAGYTDGYEVELRSQKGLEIPNYPPSPSIYVKAGDKLEAFIEITADGKNDTARINEWFNVIVTANRNLGYYIIDPALPQTTVYTAAKPPAEDVTFPVTRSIAPPTKAAVSVTDNMGYSATVHWTMPPENSDFLVLIKDANGAIIWKNLWGGDSIDFSEYNLDFTPKARYTVEVRTVGETEGMYSSPLIIPVTMKDFPPPTVKLTGKPGLIGAAFAIIPSPSISVEATEDSDVLFYLEITSVVDAKGKPEWKAGSYQCFSGEDILESQSLVFEDFAFQAGTEYFVRAVQVFDHSTGIKMVATGKEIKFKTIVPPAPTIGRIGFDMTHVYQMGFNFSLKSPKLNDKNDILKTGLDGHKTFFSYELLVAPDTAKTGTGGVLVGAVSFGILDQFDNFDEVEDANGKLVEYRLNDMSIVTFEEVGKKLDDLKSLKGIQIQLKAIYHRDMGDSGYATVYSKAIKLTFPKWYV